MLLYRSRVFDLYTTSVSSRRAPFEYVAHRGSCAALLVDRQGALGLIAHHRPAIGHTLFELVAGTLDYERPIEEIMANELREEAGLSIEPLQLKRLTSLYASPGYTTELITLFHARVTDAQKEQCESVRWFTLDELNRHIVGGRLIDMKTVAAVTAYQVLSWRNTDEAIHSPRVA